MSQHDLDARYTPQDDSREPWAIQNWPVHQKGYECLPLLRGPGDTVTGSPIADAISYAIDGPCISALSGRTIRFPRSHQV
jgi:hypothetical protein